MSNDNDWWTGTELSDARYIPTVVVSAISSTLSIIGSSCVMYMTCRDLLTKKIMHRLIFALSFWDILASSSFLVSPFLVPSYLELPGAIGSHDSCAAVGFIWMASMPLTSFYNCYLSIYYLLVVRWSFHERDFKLHWEILAHSLAIIIPLVINIAALITDSLNPVPIVNGLCSYAAIPWGCNTEEECTRSSEATAMKLQFAQGTVICFLSVLGFICTFWVWRTVSTVIQRSNAHRFQGDNDEHNDERLKQVSRQAILYSLAYFNTFFWPMVTVAIMLFIPIDQQDMKKEDLGFYILILLFCTFQPLQGAMNFFIFTGPKVNHWRQIEPEKSRIWIYAQVLQSKQPKRHTRNTNTNNTATNNQQHQQ